MQVLVIGGGRSAEHEISLLSADFIYRTLATRHSCHVVYIDRSGAWWYVPEGLREEIRNLTQVPPADLVPVFLWRQDGRSLIFDALRRQPLAAVDIAFPALHGPWGEDGTIQGLFEMLDLPYVGAGVLGSAVCMDKATTKRVLAQCGLPVTPFHVVEAAEWQRGSQKVRQELRQNLSLPLFVKPSNLGSSIGITRVTHWSQLEAAVQRAFAYDTTILVEQAVVPVREVECSVLDGDPPRSSIVGEIRYQRVFYDYEAKYRDQRTELVIPAEIPTDLADRVRGLAVAAFVACRCEGMARVDFLLSDKRVYINELNTIPGFTPYSMYHRLWSASGMDPATLLDELLNLAVHRHRRRRALRLHPESP